MEQKRVNIFPRGAITTVIPPIRTPIHKVTKKIRDIRLALLAGARVEEILPDGSAFLLNINNYDKDNTIHVKPKNVEKVVVEASPIPPKSIRENEETPSSKDKVEKTESKPEQLEIVEANPTESIEVKPENAQPEVLTRRQRRALEAEQRRKEQEATAAIEAAKVEEVVVKDPEEGNV